jgi:hypothetical protein
MWSGFWLNAVSGTALLIANATTKATNPAFYFKMGFITLAMIILARIRRSVFRSSQSENGDVPGSAKMLATASLACWAGAITAGRLLAYFGRG